ncbi:MAG: type II and III secretion system protein family protein [Pseudomonadota bacterium]
MLKSTLSGALLVAALGSATGAQAQAVAGSATAGSLHAGALEVPMNKSKVVSTDRAIGKALVGSSEVADVLPLSERSVYVLGKKFGTTSLTLYDRNNMVLAVMDIAVGPDVDGLKAQMQQLIPGQPIDARITNESILLSGMVSDAGAADRAAQLARAFAGDKVINLITVGGSQQVMLEVRFAEVSRQLGEKIGLSGFATSDNGRFRGAIGEGASLTGGGTQSVTTNYDANGNVIGATTSGSPPQLLLGAITDSFGIFTQAFRIGSLNIDATLNMLERRGLAKTLAEPTLMALSGEKASFLAGGEFPIPVAQTGNSGGEGGSAITIEFKPFGVSLAFTPTVLGDKVINLVVEPEVSSIDPTASVSVNGLVVPGLQTRRASTTVELRDGESFAIAGLLRKDFQTTVRQLPILGSLPIIGALFRSSGFQKGETELLIVVTPRLVSPIRPEQVRLPTDRIDDPRAFDVLIDGEGYRPKRLPPLLPPASGTGASGSQPSSAPATAGAASADTAQAAGPAAQQSAPTVKEQGYEY